MNIRKWIAPLAVIGGIVVLALIFVGWGSGVYNSAVSLQEEVNSSWGNVQASYQRRADLIPNLVATVQGAADNEGKILREVTQARAGITQATTPEDLELMGKKINTAINLAFEAYPQIRSTQNFSDLQAQLEGTENRITVARNKYNEAVKNYNKRVRGFFSRFALNLFGGGEDFSVKKMFESAEGSDVAPSVNFNK
ncbi:MAG: LemA family protein [Bacteroidales bacterium]|nr:LemA family protein [Bacteroidales bacterium]